jgi:alpha 1,3-mannosyltransferase
MISGSRLTIRWPRGHEKHYLSLFLVSTCLLYIFFSNHSGRSVVSQGEHIEAASRFQHAVSDIYALNNSQWGKRGTLIRHLSQWAGLLIEHPSLDTKSFEASLQSHFPFLAGTEKTIYTPWSTIETFNSDFGFVICAGSSNFHLAAHLIATLRHVHYSTAPIEIAYAGDDDLKPEHRSFLQKTETGTSFINLLDRFPHAREDLLHSGWAMKPFALLASTHKRAVLVDADAIFLTSPDSLFETNPGLNRTGTLFFHDRAATGGDAERRDWVRDQLAAAGIQPSNFLENESLFYSGAAWYEADSGVVAMDKTRPSVILGLIFATWMNTKTVRDEVSYVVFYGDKETFWVAMELSSADYHFQPWYAGTIGHVTDEIEPGADLMENEYEICGTHMLHLDHVGQAPFWFNGGIYENKGHTDAGYTTLTHYWVGETDEIRHSQPNWYWVDGNIGCLREKGIKVLYAPMLSTIEAIKEQATRVDDLIALLPS